MGNSESDNKSEKETGNQALRATMGLMEYRDTINRMTFRESLKQGRLLLPRSQHREKLTQSAEDVQAESPIGTPQKAKGEPEE